MAQLGTEYTRKGIHSMYGNSWGSYNHDISNTNGTYHEASFQGSTSTLAIAPSMHQTSGMFESIKSCFGRDSLVGNEDFVLVRVRGEYAVVYPDHRGLLVCEASSQNLQSNAQVMLNQQFFEQMQRTNSNGMSWTHEESRVTNRGHRDERRHHQSTGSGYSGRHQGSRSSGGEHRHRKRRAPASRQPQPQYDDESEISDEEEEEESEQEVVSIKSERIKVGDAARCKVFYEKKLLAIQQVPCKAIAKEWIKAIEPKKQTKYPYNGGKAAKDAKDAWLANGKLELWDNDEGKYSAPPWWPEGVKHKEPDHIKKRDRVVLLLHILTNLYDEPGYNVRVDLLRQSTKKLIASFPETKGGPSPDEIKKYLEEIYRLREREEQVKMGGCDAGTIETFELAPVPPRRMPKKSRINTVSSRRNKQASLSASEDYDDEEEEEESQTYPNQSPSSLTSPVAKMELQEGAGMTSNNSYGRPAEGYDHFRNLPQGISSVSEPLPQSVPASDRPTLQTSKLPNLGSFSNAYPATHLNRDQLDYYQSGQVSQVGAGAKGRGIGNNEPYSTLMGERSQALDQPIHQSFPDVNESGNSLPDPNLSTFGAVQFPPVGNRFADMNWSSNPTNFGSQATQNVSGQYSDGPTATYLQPGLSRATLHRNSFNEPEHPRQASQQTFIPYSSDMPFSGQAVRMSSIDHYDNPAPMRSSFG